MEDLRLVSDNGENAETGNEMGFLHRIKGIVLSPGKTTLSLSERPRVLFGLMASILARPLLSLLRLPLLQSELRDKQLKSLTMLKEKFNYDITPEMIEKRLPVTTVTSIVSYAFAGIVSLIFLSLVFFAIFKMMGGHGKFKAYLSVTGYAYTIMLLYYAIVGAASFFTGSLYINTSLTSLANLLPQNMSGQFIYGAAGGIDLFRIWYFTVIAIGMAQVSRLKKKYVYGSVCIVFLIGLLISGLSTAAAGVLM